jgi:hypothetical protein
MPELTLLRTLREEIDEPTPERLAPAWNALQDRMAQASRPRRRLSGKGRWAVGSAGLAALAAGACAVVVISGTASPPGEADPGPHIAAPHLEALTASMVLSSAAEEALRFEDPVVAPGQYLAIRTDGLYLAQGWTEQDAERARSETDGDLSAITPASFLENFHDEVYIPADRTQEWVYIRCARSLASTFGPRSEEFAAQVERENAQYDRDRFERMPAGVWPGGGTFGGFFTGQGSSTDFASLSDDPEELLAMIYEVNGQAGQSRDGQALVWIADTLRGGTVPAEVRATLYEAAALIPGVTVTERETNLNGATGIAVGRVETVSNVRQDIIIDPDTGQFIGERTVSLDGFADIPAGTTVGYTAVTTSVVGAAPTDASTCAAD